MQILLKRKKKEKTMPDFVFVIHMISNVLNFQGVVKVRIFGFSVRIGLRSAGSSTGCIRIKQ